MDAFARKTTANTVFYSAFCLENPVRGFRMVGPGSAIRPYPCNAVAEIYCDFLKIPTA